MSSSSHSLASWCTSVLQRSSGVSWIKHILASALWLLHLYLHRALWEAHRREVAAEREGQERGEWPSRGHKYFFKSKTRKYLSSAVSLYSSLKLISSVQRWFDCLNFHQKLLNSVFASEPHEAESTFRVRCNWSIKPTPRWRCNNTTEEEEESHFTQSLTYTHRPEEIQTHMWSGLFFRIWFIWDSFVEVDGDDDDWWWWAFHTCSVKMMRTDLQIL